jgi:phosphoglycolate phosphatase
VYSFPPRDKQPDFRGLSRHEISHVIFDFDGTLSWLRHGWPHLMLEVFLKHAPQKWTDDLALRAQLFSDILSLNGKPSSYQAELFCSRVLEAGFVTDKPGEILSKYQSVLRAVVEERMTCIQKSRCSVDDFVIWGARRTLEFLFSRGLTLIILSGTVQQDVLAEAELLGLSRYFGRHIYGSPAHGHFSKRDGIDQILREEGIVGRHLLSFGDGPVETEFTKAAGGLAIGVASDENENGSHKVDPLKRDQLIRAGADAIIADYDEAEAVLTAVFSK